MATQHPKRPEPQGGQLTEGTPRPPLRETRLIVCPRGAALSNTHHVSDESRTSVCSALPESTFSVTGKPHGDLGSRVPITSSNGFLTETNVRKERIRASACSVLSCGARAGSRAPPPPHPRAQNNGASDAATEPLVGRSSNAVRKLGVSSWTQGANRPVSQERPGPRLRPSAARGPRTSIQGRGQKAGLQPDRCRGHVRSGVHSVPSVLLQLFYWCII